MLLRTGRSGPDWIWHGLLARLTPTLLTGHGKLTGKTTLLSILLSRRARGGQLAGLAVNPGKTIIVSEERPLVVELNADATDYVQVVETAPDEFERYFLAALVRAAILAS